MEYVTCSFSPFNLDVRKSRWFLHHMNLGSSYMLLILIRYFVIVHSADEYKDEWING